MANPNRKDEGAPPSNVHVGPASKKMNWLVWLLPALAILALLFGLAAVAATRRLSARSRHLLMHLPPKQLWSYRGRQA